MLDDLRAFLDAPELILPIGGKQYAVRPVSAAVWLRLQEINARAEEAVQAGNANADLTSIDAALTELDLFKLALGSTFDEMLASDVTGPELKQAGITAFFWQLGQETIAEAYWRTGGKASAAVEPPPSTSTTTARANTTRKRASTSSTTSPKASTRQKPKKN